jgi:protein O-GlcNAc transferase
MEPWFAEDDKKMFYRYLDNTTNYFEYGSGGSTYQVNKYPNIGRIFSVESDPEWHESLKNRLDNPERRIRFLYVDMDTHPKTWGSPGPRSNCAQWINYSSQIEHLDWTLSRKLDMVLIDGRFRVACCLKCHGVVNDECVIAFDDFVNRPGYHVVLDYFDVVEKTADDRMVMLKKKPDTTVPRELIEKYNKVKQ